MKIAYINSVPYGSTGKIVQSLASEAKKNGIQTLIYYSWTKKMPSSNSDEIIVGSFIEKVIHIGISKIIGFNGFFSIYDTLRLIFRLKNFKPDIIHIHILHAWSINLWLLFNYIKKENIAVIWTMHDCWPYTGKCCHYSIAGCYKWKTGCSKCMQLNKYPESMLDSSRIVWKLKKKIFGKLKNCMLVAPSRWMEGEINKSFLRDYNKKVIYNGINLEIFRPRYSNLRKDLDCEEKYIILGIAYEWTYEKGIDVMLKLSDCLDDTFKIVLVGKTDSSIKKSHKKIKFVERIENQVKLAEFYTMADVFVNPTREEVLGLVNIEAIACGTPVITFSAGGSPECVDETCGMVVDIDDVEGMMNQIKKMKRGNLYNTEACIKFASRFDGKQKSKEYINIYRSVISQNEIC